jgi:pentatricopeptide repeat protein
LEPDAFSYTTAIGACAKAGLPEEALRLLTEMEVEAQLVPDLLTYNGVIAALGQAGRWKDAIEYMNILYRKGFKPDVFTYTNLIIVGIAVRLTAMEGNFGDQGNFGDHYMLNQRIHGHVRHTYIYIYIYIIYIYIIILIY